VAEPACAGKWQTRKIYTTVMNFANAKEKGEEAKASDHFKQRLNIDVL
jgi:hypothetical protein